MKLKFLLVYFNVQNTFQLIDAIASVYFSFFIYFAVNWISRLCGQSLQLIPEKMDLLLRQAESDNLQRMENKRKQPIHRALWVTIRSDQQDMLQLAGLCQNYSTSNLAKWAAPGPNRICCRILSVIHVQEEMQPRMETPRQTSDPSQIGLMVEEFTKLETAHTFGGSIWNAILFCLVGGSVGMP